MGPSPFLVAIARDSIASSRCAFFIRQCCCNMQHMNVRRIAVFALLLPLIVLLTGSSLLVAQGYDAAFFKDMKWRVVGPFRGGRVLAVTGVPGEPNLYYFGAVAGGVFKSVDGGQNWTPVFDKENISSVGAIAVADSNHNVIYVGTGEACIRGNISHGDGVYRSLDGGKTWKNTGLRDSRAIGKVIVNATNPDIAFVAALGHPYGPNTERGI